MTDILVPLFLIFTDKINCRNNNITCQPLPTYVFFTDKSIVCHRFDAQKHHAVISTHCS